MLNAKIEGKIVFWNGTFGFIQYLTNGSVFFYHDSIVDIKKSDLHLLDEVTFTISQTSAGRHQGKLIALNIEKVKEFDLKEHSRFVGKLTQWDGTKGNIISPQQSKSITFFNTRRLYLKDRFENGDLVVFNQVKSSNNPDELFAFFAYSLKREREIDFLTSAYQDTLIEEIRHQISYVLKNDPKYSVVEIFNYELESLGFIDNHPAFLALIKLLKDYQKKKHRPPYADLARFCEEKYLIQLWEMKVIDEYDIELIKKYFHVASLETKHFILSRLSLFAEEILSDHFDKLRQIESAKIPSNEVKVLLDVAYKHQNTNIYPVIRDYLLSTLNSKELIDFWIRGYIDELPEILIIENLDIDNPAFIKLFLKKEGKYAEMVYKKFECFFVGLSAEDFIIHLPLIIKRLIIFRKEFAERNSEIIHIVRTKSDDLQKFVLWIFGVFSGFDAYGFLFRNHLAINDFYKIKYFIHTSVDASTLTTRHLLNEVNISQEGLVAYIKGSPWNDFIQPTKTTPAKIECSFLPDVKEFKNRFSRQDISLENLSLSIFESLPKFQIIHLRLWLYNYVDVSFYHHIGFRTSFMFLSVGERAKFKDKAREFSISTAIDEPEILQVKPCKIILEKTSEATTYSATIENIYFVENGFKLRKENNEYTEQNNESRASSGLNRIPSNSNLNKVKISISVNNENHVIATDGFDELFILIETGEIERALTRILGNDSQGDDHTYVEDNTYVEDWVLRGEIINYLNENQTDAIEAKPVYEPKTPYRRLDENSTNISKELTQLYTIKSQDGFAIVWENIDLTEDRATYVFKAQAPFLRTQVDKIAHSIVSLAQFRSTLSSNDSTPKLIIFKSDLGFIGSIHKQRGKNHSFDNWLSKLDILVTKQIPDLPTSEQTDLITNWTLQIPHVHIRKRNRSSKRNTESWEDITTDLKGKVKEIDQNDIETINMDFGNSVPTDMQVAMAPKTIVDYSENKLNERLVNRKQALLASLLLFNNEMIEKLKIR